MCDVYGAKKIALNTKKGSGKNEKVFKKSPSGNRRWVLTAKAKSLRKKSKSRSRSRSSSRKTKRTTRNVSERRRSRSRSRSNKRKSRSSSRSRSSSKKRKSRSKSKTRSRVLTGRARTAEINKLSDARLRKIKAIIDGKKSVYCIHTKRQAKVTGGRHVVKKRGNRISHSVTGKCNGKGFNLFV